MIAICSEEEDRCKSGKLSWNVSIEMLSDPECILANRFHMLISKPSMFVSKYHKFGIISESGVIFLKKNEMNTKEDLEINWFDFENKQELLYHNVDSDFTYRVDLQDIYEKIVKKKLKNEEIDDLKVKSTGNLMLKGIGFSKKKKNKQKQKIEKN